MELISMGTDFEVFLRDRETGQFVSAVDRIGGSKNEPVWVKGGNLQEDNVMAECAINPAFTKEEWVHNIKDVKTSLQERVPWAELVFIPAVTLPHSMFEDKRTRVFGCDPDYAADSSLENMPLIGQAPTHSITIGPQGVRRSAGGHIHFGFKDVSKWDVKTHSLLVNFLTCIFGGNQLHHLYIRDVQHINALRRRLGYRANRFRSKSYGFEWRGPSNMWVDNDELIERVWDWSHMFFHFANNWRSYKGDNEVISRWHDLFACLSENKMRRATVNLVQLTHIHRVSGAMDALMMKEAA